MAEYSDDLGTRIVEYMLDGRSLRWIAEQDGMPAYQTIVRWAGFDQHPFRRKFLCAMQTRQLLIPMEVQDLVADITDKQSAVVNRAKGDLLIRLMQAWSGPWADAVEFKTSETDGGLKVVVGGAEAEKAQQQFENYQASKSGAGEPTHGTNQKSEPEQKRPRKPRSSEAQRKPRAGAGESVVERLRNKRKLGQ